jgi:hypothetical protein
MKIILYAAATFIMVSCSPVKNQEAEPSADAIQIVTDTVSVTEEVVATVEETPVELISYQPPKATGIFPYFSEDSLTGDEIETLTLRAINDLLNKYQTKNYYHIQSEYAVDYKKEWRPEEILDFNESEKKIWYYDSTFTLRCYTTEYLLKISDGDYQAKTIIYLFSDNALIAVYRHDFNSEKMAYDATNSYWRLVAAQCPACGAYTYEVPMNDGVFKSRELDQALLAEWSGSFDKEYKNLFGMLRVSNAKVKNEAYHVRQNITTPNAEAVAEYTIDAIVYDNEIKSPYE